MFNTMKEMRRKKENGIYDLTLEIAEKDYFETYENVDNRAAKDIMNQYLSHVQDDARFQNAKIHHNRNRHTVRLTSELHYLKNDHTDYNIDKR